MLALIQEALKAGKVLGFPPTRMIAHAETAGDDWSSANEWVEYEFRLNDVLPRYDDPVICTYDANLLNANLALDILRTHPVAIIGGVLVENSFSSRPEESARGPRANRGAPAVPRIRRLRMRVTLIYIGYWPEPRPPSGAVYLSGHNNIVSVSVGALVFVKCGFGGGIYGYQLHFSAADTASD
jgi:hypothetical protein